MALQPWRQGTVIRIADHGPHTRSFWIEVPDVTQFDFIPGQFVTLDLPIHEKPNKRLRSYSIASGPDGSNIFELLIARAKDGVGTEYLFNEIGVGSPLIFRGPQGVFSLPSTLDKDIFLICTGTGIAPFRSMVRHIARNRLPFRTLHLIFGCRNREDLLYYDEFRELEKTLPGFHYHPTLSREHWEGHHGYVHPVYQQLCSGRPDAIFLLCGWKQMIDDARDHILNMGYDRKAIRQELYG